MNVKSTTIRYLPPIMIVVLLLLFILIGASCKNSDEEVVPHEYKPIQLLRNRDITKEHRHWVFETSSRNGKVLPQHYTHEWSKEHTMVPGRFSLKISSDSFSEPYQYAYWIQEIYVPRKENSTALPENPVLVLKANVLVNNVKGYGASIAMEAYSIRTSTSIFKSSEGVISIKGSSEKYMEYTIQMPYDNSLRNILVYLVMLDQTKGTVYFDNISLTLENKPDNNNQNST